MGSVGLVTDHGAWPHARGPIQHAAPGYVVAAVIVAISIVASPVHGQDESSESPRPLFLAADRDGTLAETWFTTYEADADNATRAVELRQTQGMASAAWRLETPPQDWNLSSGTSITYAIWVRDLDQVIPDADTASMTPLGSMDVVFVFRDGDATAEADPVAEATHRFRFDQLPAGDILLEGLMESTRAAAFVAGDAFSAMVLSIEVRGARGIEGSDIDVLVGSQEHDSQLHVPGFPWQALRSAEDAAALDADCRERALNGDPCPDGPGADNNTTSGRDGRATPMLPRTWVLLAFGFMAMARAITTNRRERI